MSFKRKRREFSNDKLNDSQPYYYSYGPLSKGNGYVIHGDYQNNHEYISPPINYNSASIPSRTNTNGTTNGSTLYNPSSISNSNTSSQVWNNNSSSSLNRPSSTTSRSSLNISSSVYSTPVQNTQNTQNSQNSQNTQRAHIPRLFSTRGSLQLSQNSYHHNQYSEQNQNQHSNYNLYSLHSNYEASAAYKYGSISQHSRYLDNGSRSPPLLPYSSNSSNSSSKSHLHSAYHIPTHSHSNSHTHDNYDSLNRSTYTNSLLKSASNSNSTTYEDSNYYRGNLLQDKRPLKRMRLSSPSRMGASTSELNFNSYSSSQRSNYQKNNHRSTSYNSSRHSFTQPSDSYSQHTSSQYNYISNPSIQYSISTTSNYNASTHSNSHQNDSSTNSKNHNLFHNHSQISNTSNTSNALQLKPSSKGDTFRNFSSQKSSTNSKSNTLNSYDDSEGHYRFSEGEILLGQYKIVEFLGSGTFAKVVKCVDIYQNRLVAIKIIRSLRKYTEAAKIEISVLNDIKEKDRVDKYHCIRLLRSFTFKGHVCLVFPLFGISIFDFIKDNNYIGFNISQIQHITRQFLEGIKFLHNEMKIVHTDLKPENILLVKEEFDEIPLPYGWKKSGVKESNMMHVPKCVDIKIIDFGSAAYEYENHTSIISTRHYRAPEVILGLGWSYPADMWSVGCIFFELLTGDALFQTHDNAEHLAMMRKYIGELPLEMYHKSSASIKKYFTAEGSLNWPEIAPSQESIDFVKNLKAMEDSIQIYTKKEQSVAGSLFKDLVNKLLIYQPSHRLTASEALLHPFFQLKLN